MKQTPADPVSLALYMRGSTIDQKNTLFSQHENCLRWSQAMGHKLPPVSTTVTLIEETDGEVTRTPHTFEHAFVDYGVSAEKVDFLMRPEAHRMVQWMEETGANTIVIPKLDRGFRKTVDCLSTVEALEKRGIKIILLDFGGNTVDMNTAMGKFALTVAVAAAELENGRRRERQADTTVSMRLRNMLTGEVRYGWMKVPDIGRHTKNLKRAKTTRETYGTTAFRVVPHPFEMQVLRLICVDMADVCVTQMAKHLNQEGIPAKKGGKWFPNTVASVREHAVLAEDAADEQQDAA